MCFSSADAGGEHAAVRIVSLGKPGLQGQVSRLPCWIGWSLSRIPHFLPIYTEWTAYNFFFFPAEKKTKGCRYSDDYNEIVMSGLNCQPVCRCGGEHEKDCSLLLALPTIITPNQIMVTPCSVQQVGFPDSNTISDRYRACFYPSWCL